MLRIIKIMLAAAVAAFMFAGAFGNVTDWGGTTGAVAATTSMSTFDGGAESWRATSSPIVVTLGAVFIVVSKLFAGGLCLAGAANMSGAIGADAAAFARAKRLALAGCGYAMFFLFAGWIVIAETWFELWRSDIFRDVALQSAFRYGAMATLIALFIADAND